jgi:hypothetical protein
MNYDILKNGTQDFPERSPGWYFPRAVTQLFELRQIDALDFLLLGRINALCLPKKGCWAGNEWLANWAGISERSISQRLAHLKSLGLIRIKLKRQGEGRGTRRAIFTTFEVEENRYGPLARNGQWSTRDHRSATSSVDYALLRKAHNSVAPRRGGHLGEFFNFDGDIVQCSKKDRATPYHKEATELARQFHQYLVQYHFHLNRKDLPRGNKPEDIMRRKSTFKKWTSSASILLQQLDGDYEHVRQVLDWYFPHCRDTYVTHLRTMTEFCEKFFNLEKVMHKQEGVHKPNSRIIVERLS